MALNLTTFVLLLILAKASALKNSEAWKLNKNLNNFALIPQALPTGTCNADTPCENRACCGLNGLCGYSPTECGSGNCTSNCDAKAECGQYALPGHQDCPLKVCCSQYGFCGSTDGFCGHGCQHDFGGCGPPKRPKCSSGSAVSKRTIGYYEAWSNTRPCQKVAPEDLNLNGFTHINFAFAFFDPASFQIAPMDRASASLFSRFTALKENYRGLQTWISVGGWSFTDPGSTRRAFGTMSSSATTRRSFMNGLMRFMDNYGFDGVDLDWEYPQADDRGGTLADKSNYVSLVKEMKAAFGSKYGLSMTLPTSYWYLQHFDLSGIQDHVDWFNLMSYDLHGVWDKDSKFMGPYIAAHTNITEVDLGLDLLWRAGVDSSKVVLGQAWYGRSFTLSDPSCNKPDGTCQFSGGAKAGPCSNASGILGYQEIQDVISKNHLKPEWDKKAAVKWITWDDDQWVSYDDKDTFAQKQTFAKSRCLGGLMVWAMDQVDQKADNGLSSAFGVTPAQQKDADQMGADIKAGMTCYTTDCAKKCKKGTSSVAKMNGQPGQLSVTGRCDKKKYRSLCCDHGTTMGTCQWRGYRGVGLSCIGGCADGEVEVVRNTNHHEKNGDRNCNGGLQSYCCKGFKAAPSRADLQNKAVDAAKSEAEAASAEAALDVAAKAFCRLAVPALLAPLEAVEALIPILGKFSQFSEMPAQLNWVIGEIADIAEVAATPALVQLCIKGIEKAGKAEFKVFGKKHTLKMDEPKERPSSVRKAESSHPPPKTSRSQASPTKSKDSCKSLNEAVGDGEAARRTYTSTVTKLISDNTAMAVTRDMVCDYSIFGQACLHYSSVIANNPGYNQITCPFKRVDALSRPVVAQFNKERNNQWIPKIPAALMPGKGCERDEWPPAALHEVNNGVRGFNAEKYSAQTQPHAALMSRTQYVRYLDAVRNNEAGKLWAGCPRVASWDTVNPPPTSLQEEDCKRPTEWILHTKIFFRSVFRMEFNNMPIGIQDAGLGAECLPLEIGADGRTTSHTGFRLLNHDPWFDRGANAWARALTSSYSVRPNFKRRVLDLDAGTGHGVNDTDVCFEGNGPGVSSGGLREPTAVEAGLMTTVGVPTEIASRVAQRDFTSHLPSLGLPRETGSAK